MPRTKNPENFKRYRFSVPNADESVTSWIAAQSNLSYSIRELIKTAIRCNGYSDVSCYPVRQLMMEMPMPVTPGGSYPIEYAMIAQANGGQPGYPQQPVQPPVPGTPAPSVYPGQSFPQAPQPQAPAPGFAPPAAPVPPQPVPQPPTASQDFVDPADLLG